MNDIAIKIVESPKDRLADVSPSEIASENEVDPLSIDDLKDPLLLTDKVGEDKDSCDDDAKVPVSEAGRQSENPQLCETAQEAQLKEVDIPVAITEENAAAVESNYETKKTGATDIIGLQAEEHIELNEKETFRRIESVKVEVKYPVGPDVEMTEVPVGRIEKDPKRNIQPVNGDISKEEQSTKRRASEDVEKESPLKKLCAEVEKTFPQHDIMVNDYIQTATKNNVDEIQRHTEQLLSEIQTLRELAQKKEHEWNNILHLKKVKEEILLRLLRRKQVLSFEKNAEVNGSERNDPFDYLNQAKNLAIDKSDEISGLSIKQPGSMINPLIQPIMPVTSHFNPMSGLPPPYDKAAHMQAMPKPVFPQGLMMPGPMPVFPRDMNGQLTNSYGLPMGRQGPTKDVKSIIADYRQRNPDITPRRGRRMKGMVNPNMMNTPRPIAPKMDNMNNLSNLNMLFNNLDMNQKAMLERLQQIQAGGLPNGLSFKDVLVQFANMQQTNVGLMPNRPLELNRPDLLRPDLPRPERRRERNQEEAHMSVKQPERVATSSPRLPPPPPYPEISLLPVTTSQETSQTQQQNSLLHGILTKPAPPASQSYSPTLAKLLTSPERKQSTTTPPLPSFGQAKAADRDSRSSCAPAAPTSGTAREIVRWQPGMTTPKCARGKEEKLRYYFSCRNASYEKIHISDVPTPYRICGRCIKCSF
ncbi:jg24017 [Pararge aegeria aegeria]|uniref:Jg24017 protein n=1 Tax=Pararge aegeria aegeria TaxID=348720 RepID=A0A8S4SFZ5_9NEOP|nr:jg24017 [Pararge aegeria aegeria]